MRKAALNATTYEQPIQKAVAFHEQRVEQILNGDHELDVGDPHLVAHMIPEGGPNTDSLAANKNIDEQIPNFDRVSSWRPNHKYGQITTPAHGVEDQQAYNLRLFAGGFETVSAAEISDYRDDELFLAAQSEAKLAATANWAQEALEDEYESDWLAVLVTLTGVGGKKLRIPDSAPRPAVSEAVFGSDHVNPWPVKIPLESTTPADTYELMSPLFDRLWTDAGLHSSIFCPVE